MIEADAPSQHDWNNIVDSRNVNPHVTAEANKPLKCGPVTKTIKQVRNSENSILYLSFNK